MFSTSFVLCTLRLLKLCLFFCNNKVQTLLFLFISVHILFTFYLTSDHFTLVSLLLANVRKTFTMQSMDRNNANIRMFVNTSWKWPTKGVHGIWRSYGGHVGLHDKKSFNLLKSLYSAPIRAMPEKLENALFTLKTHQMSVFRALNTWEIWKRNNHQSVLICVWKKTSAV